MNASSFLNAYVSSFSISKASIWAFKIKVSATLQSSWSTLPSLSLSIWSNCCKRTSLKDTSSSNFAVTISVYSSFDIRSLSELTKASKNISSNSVSTASSIFLSYLRKNWLNMPSFNARKMKILTSSLESVLSCIK